MDFLNISCRLPKLACATLTREVVRAAVSAPLAALMWLTEPLFAVETTLEPPESPGAPRNCIPCQATGCGEEPARPIYIENIGS